MTAKPSSSSATAEKPIVSPVSLPPTEGHQTVSDEDTVPPPVASVSAAGVVPLIEASTADSRYIVRQFDMKDSVAEDRRLRDILTVVYDRMPTDLYNDLQYVDSIVIFCVEKSKPRNVLGYVTAIRDETQESSEEEEEDDDDVAITTAVAKRQQKQLRKIKKPRRFYVPSIFVHMSHRRQGLGRRLIHELHKTLLANYPSVAVAASFNSDRELQAFYASLGYEIPAHIHRPASSARRPDSDPTANAFGGRRATRYLSRTSMLSQFPEAFEKGQLHCRRAMPCDQKVWEQLILGACDWAAGGREMIDKTNKAEFRCVVVDATTDRPVGCVSAEKRGWIPFLAIAPDWHRRRLGTFLLTLALEWMRLEAKTAKQKITEAYLTPLESSNIPFYVSNGFESDRTTGAAADRVLYRFLDPNAPLLPLQWTLQTVLATGLKGRSARDLDPSAGSSNSTWDCVFADELAPKKKRLRTEKKK